MGEDCIPVNARTAALVRFAARIADVSESVIVERAVLALSGPDKPQPPADPWQPVPIYCEYGGQQVAGEYLPATGRLTVRSGPLVGTTYKSPSAAARAVVAVLNPARADSPLNGWRYWRLAGTHQRLDVLR